MRAGRNRIGVGAVSKGRRRRSLVVLWACATMLFALAQQALVQQALAQTPPPAIAEAAASEPSHDIKPHDAPAQDSHTPHPLATLWADLQPDERLECTPEGYEAGRTVRSFTSRRLVNALVRAHLFDIPPESDGLYSRGSLRRWLGDAVAQRMRERAAAAFQERDAQNENAPSDDDRAPEGVSLIADSMLQMLALSHPDSDGRSMLSWTSPTGGHFELRRTDRLIFSGGQPYEENFLLQALNAPDSWAREVLADTGDRFRILATCPEYGDRFVSARSNPRSDKPFLTRLRQNIAIGADENDVERPLGQRRGAGLSLTSNNENRTLTWDWEFGVSITPWRLPTPWTGQTLEQVNREFFQHFAVTPDETFSYDLSGATLRPYVVVNRRATVDRDTDETDVNVDFVSFGMQLTSFVERGRALSRKICPEGSARTPPADNGGEAAFNPPDETTSEATRAAGLLRLPRLGAVGPCLGPDDSDPLHGPRAYKTNRWRLDVPVSLEWVSDTEFRSSLWRAQLRVTPTWGILGDPQRAFRAPIIDRTPLLRRVFFPYVQILASPAADYAEVLEPGETLPLQDVERYFRVGGDFELNVHFNSVSNPSASRLRWFNSYQLRDDISPGDRADATFFQSEISVLMPGDRVSIGLEFEEGEDARTLRRDERLQLIARYRM